MHNILSIVQPGQNNLMDPISDPNNNIIHFTTFSISDISFAFIHNILSTINKPLIPCIAGSYKFFFSWVLLSASGSGSLTALSMIKPFQVSSKSLRSLPFFCFLLQLEPVLTSVLIPILKLVMITARKRKLSNRNYEGKFCSSFEQMISVRIIW